MTPAAPINIPASLVQAGDSSGTHQHPCFVGSVTTHVVEEVAGRIEGHIPERFSDQCIGHRVQVADAVPLESTRVFLRSLVTRLWTCFFFKKKTREYVERSLDAVVCDLPRDMVFEETNSDAALAPDVFSWISL